MNPRQAYLKSIDSYGGRCDCCRGKNEPYMVKHHVWNHIVEKGESFVCITCVEERLGRKLEVSDFTEAPINFGIFDFDCEVYCSLVSF